MLTGIGAPVSAARGFQSIVAALVFFGVAVAFLGVSSALAAAFFGVSSAALAFGFFGVSSALAFAFSGVAAADFFSAAFYFCRQ